MSPHKVEPAELNGNGYDNNTMSRVTIKPQPIYAFRKMRIVCIGAGASGMVRLALAQVLEDDIWTLLLTSSFVLNSTWPSARSSS